MTKQEEIREGLIAKVKSIRLWRTIYDDPLTPEEDADDILRTLDSQGVVIKVNRVHDSDCAVHNMPAYPNGPCDCRVLPVGCVAVEPLIEVKE